MNSAEVLIKFKGDTTNADSSVQKMSGSIDGLTKSFTLANLAAEAITKTIGIMTSSIDGAVNRVDTLNNFPRVMSNLGISAEESAEVINDLSEKLKGLPTSLDNAAGAVQRFASKNGNVKESEKVFLAVNNAILAGGANAQTQASALEQISQAYAKGKPDMMEWRSLMTAMPAQLKQVATAMGYTDAAMLGEAVRAENGEEVFSKMIDTMVRMNEEGVAGFKSFDEQARNATGGIGTSITNMRTAITRGVGNIILKLDEALQPLGGISGVITTIGKIGEQVFSGIGDILKEIMPTLMKIGEEIMPIIMDIIKTLAPPLSKLVKALLPPLSKILEKILPVINRMIKKILPVLEKLIEAIIPLLDPIADLLLAIMDVQLAIMEPLIDVLTTILPPIIDALSILISTYLPVLTGALQLVASVIRIVVDTAKNLIQGLITFIMTLPETIGNIIGSIIDFITKLPENIGYIIGNIAGAIYNFVTKTIPEAVGKLISIIAEIPGKVWEFVSQIPGKIWNALTNAVSKAKEGIGKVFNTIVNKMKELPGKMVEIGKNIVKGIWDGIKSMIGWIGEKIGDFCGGIVNGFKGFLGIHSPSVVLKKQIGVNLGLGVIEGLDDTTNQINKAIGGISNNITAGLGFGGVNYSQSNSMKPIINVYNDVSTDPLGQTVSNIKTFSGGAKNDYNYGMGV